MNNTVKDSAIKKLKLLITVVDRPKGEFYLDVLGQYNVNFQMVTNGQGTAIYPVPPPIRAMGRLPAICSLFIRQSAIK